MLGLIAFAPPAPVTEIAKVFGVAAVTDQDRAGDGPIHAKSELEALPTGTAYTKVTDSAVASWTAVEARV
jgi:hypothetical protein